MDPTKPKKATQGAVLVTANRLADGRVVWLGDISAEGTPDWTPSVNAARIFEESEVDSALACAASSENRQEVVGGYKVAVDRGEDGPVPHLWRERIRAWGPSISPVVG